MNGSNNNTGDQPGPVRACESLEVCGLPGFADHECRDHGHGPRSLEEQLKKKSLSLGKGDTIAIKDDLRQRSFCYERRFKVNDPTREAG